jgi:phospholipid transport system substrate-binding protein
MKTPSLLFLFTALAGTSFAAATASPSASVTAPSPAAAAAKSADPTTMLRAAVDEVLAIAYPEKIAADSVAPAPLAERVRPVLEKYFSFDLLTRSAVGPGWNQIKANDQQRIITLFTTLVIRTYSDKFEPGARPGITYAKPVEIDAARRELPTAIACAGKNYSVSYRVRQQPEGWRIYDVNVEGVSMVANYRAQFDPLFQKGGAAAIIAAIEKNIADYAAANK